MSVIQAWRFVEEDCWGRQLGRVLWGGGGGSMGRTCFSQLQMAFHVWVVGVIPFILALVSLITSLAVLSMALTGVTLG